VSSIFWCISANFHRSVSTEKPRDLLPNTIYLDWPEDQLISHSVWSTTESGPLLIGGTNTLRLYGVRKTGQEVLHRTIRTDFKDFEVEALCWLSHSQAAASVVGKSVNRPGEETRQLIYLSQWGQAGPQVLEYDTGIVFALRYNQESGLLLALAQNHATTISIVRISDNTATHLCLKEFSQYNLFDAAWMTPTKFIACGTDILQIFEFISHSDSTYEIRLIQSHDMHCSWYRIKFDPVSQIAALVDEIYEKLRQYNVANEDTKTQAFTDSAISDFAFQPIPNPDTYDSNTTPRLLATSTKDGTIQLWDVMRPFTCVHRLSLPAYGNTITMVQISFSPDGYLLAGAGYDTVAVWRPEEGGQPKAVWRCTDSETWRSEPPETEKEDWVHTLDWVSDLAFLEYPRFRTPDL
jgi:transducin (beta)-like 1